MQIITNIPDFQQYRQKLKGEQKTVGFVPTMGALHDGHLSLVRQSMDQCDATVVSIFVNPTQFNEAEDYKNYPRNFQRDCDFLSSLLGNSDAVFMPSAQEMYPEEDKRKFSFGPLETVMEGANRPGHFNGVAQVVSKLFSIVDPHRAFFGEKDYQQFKIIQALVKQLNLDIQIVPCPLIREDNGLAMSSRNERLSPRERVEAGKISQTLNHAGLFFDQNTIPELKQWVSNEFLKWPMLALEYFEIVNEADLQAVEEKSKDLKLMGFVAVRIGNVRLIDNVKLNF